VRAAELVFEPDGLDGVLVPGTRRFRGDAGINVGVPRPAVGLVNRLAKCECLSLTRNPVPGLVNEQLVADAVATPDVNRDGEG
jgi:hypothetical protein